MDGAHGRDLRVSPKDLILQHIFSFPIQFVGIRIDAGDLLRPCCAGKPLQHSTYGFCHERLAIRREMVDLYRQIIRKSDLH